MAVNLEIRAAPLTGGRFLDDYQQQSPRLAPFFTGSPFDPDAYRRKAEEVRGRFTAERLARMAGAVRPLSPEAGEKLEAVASGDGFMVTTGQQPGLFGGPLYTVHKALSAVALADRLETLLEVPVLPIFWVASDDHDWEEANHVHLLDSSNTLHRLTLEGTGNDRRSMGRRALNGAAESALDELEEILPSSEFTPDLLKQIRGAYGGGTVASAFTAILEQLFAGLPLGLVDSQAEAVRDLARPVIRRELEEAASHEAALRRQTDRLEEAGYAAQVPILEDMSNVFYEDDEGGRERLARENGGWTLRASERRLSEAEVASLLEKHPERFSPNVVLRPVVESAVFPTLAYVGGPGEVRYLGQTGCLFEAHGVGMPLVYPRLSVLLVERKVAKVLDKFELDPAALVGRPVHEVVAERVREDVPEEVKQAIGRMRKSLQEGYQAVFDAAHEVDPTLKGPIFGARNEGFVALSEVEKKVRQHVKLQRETELEQIDKAAVNLAPEGRPQERVLNIYQYLARYGAELVPAILERLEIRLGSAVPQWAGVECDP